MNRNLSNTLGLVLVNLMPYLVNFLVLPLYSQYINLEGFGVIGLVMACVVFASTWSGLQLSSALARYYFDYESIELKRYVTTIVISTLAFTAAFCFLYVLLSGQLSRLIAKDGFQQQTYFLGVGLIYLSVLNTVFEKLLINERKGGYILVRSITAQIFSVMTGVYLIVYQKQGVDGFLYATLVYYSLLVLLSLFLVRKYFILSFEFYYLRLSIKYSYPLIYHALGGVVFMYSTTFFIEEMLSLTFVGMFFIADKFSQVVKSIVNALNSAIMPVYNGLSMVDFNKGKGFIVELMPVWFLLVLTGVLNFSFLAQSFISSFMSEEYSDLTVIIMVMSLAYIFRGFYCFSTAPLFFRKKTSVIPKITMITGVFSLAYNYIFVLSLGLPGAAVSVFLSFLTNFIISLFYAGEEMKLDYPVKTMVSLMVFVFSFNFPVLFFIKDMNFYILLLVSIVLFLLTLLLCYLIDLSGIKYRISYLRNLI